MIFYRTNPTGRLADTFATCEATCKDALEYVCGFEPANYPVPATCQAHMSPYLIDHLSGLMDQG